MNTGNLFAIFIEWILGTSSPAIMKIKGWRPKTKIRTYLVVLSSNLQVKPDFTNKNICSSNRGAPYTAWIMRNWWWYFTGTMAAQQVISPRESGNDQESLMPIGILSFALLSQVWRHTQQNKNPPVIKHGNWNPPILRGSNGKIIYR